MYVGSTQYTIYTLAKKKNDHDETDYLTSFHSCRLISLSIFTHVYIIHEIVFLIAELLKYTRNVSRDTYTGGTVTSFKGDA